MGTNTAKSPGKMKREKSEEVDEAGEESFPASDPPSFATPHRENPKEKSRCKPTPPREPAGPRRPS